MSSSPARPPAFQRESRLFPRTWGTITSLLATGFLFSAATPASAALEIVPSGSEENAIYRLKDSTSGKVLGTFWDRAKDKSDYEYSSGSPPEFHWSEDRKYLAVDGGEPRSRNVYLYQVAEKSLKPVSIPALTAEQSAPLDGVKNVRADGNEVVRWQKDGTLLLHYYAIDTADSETDPKKAHMWADLQVKGAEAKVVGTSTEPPSDGAGPPPPPPVENPNPPENPPEATADFDPTGLVGTHVVQGKNPNGTAYKGKIGIAVKNGIVRLEWTIGKDVSHGTGVMAGNTLGVALDEGLAIYRVVGQAGGISLIGLWASKGGTAPNEEAILIGEADMTSAKLDAAEINGSYKSLREVKDGQVEGTVTIAGGDALKKIQWTTNGKAAKCQGLALSDGLVVLTPSGLSVFEKRANSLEGKALIGKDKVSQESLIPAE